MLRRGCGTHLKWWQTLQGVTKSIASGSTLERCATEGKGPVSETYTASGLDFPSSAGTVKTGVNLRGPPRKAKYTLATDSARVP